MTTRSGDGADVGAPTHLKGPATEARTDMPPVVLDNRSAPCAVGLIRAARTMAELEPGSVLEIWTRDRFAPVEIPLWAVRDGHRVTDARVVGWWPWRYQVYSVRRG